MSRIIAGKYRGRTLSVPARGTRPTASRIREALFSRLESWGEVRDAQVLDLYAGSGALALEALSRGASCATAVDRSSSAAKACRENAGRCGSVPLRVVTQDALSFVRRGVPAQTYTLVFMDPPYDVHPEEVANVLAGLSGLLVPNALVVVETANTFTPAPWPSGYQVDDERQWGQTRVWFLNYHGEDGNLEA